MDVLKCVFFYLIVLSQVYAEELNRLIIRDQKVLFLAISQKITG